ncbi:ATP-binding protein [Labrenzia sp. CE80]|uniref:ATP-binding protein n=1 Tax=Labrenzia sp. CE80 TaxID=1788986 RepID=UPI00129BE0D1|nr:ATP-binding protein [Labrenzia sp. CE80]
MTEVSSEPAHSSVDYKPASPFSRLREARWQLISAAGLGLASNVFFDVPWQAVLGAIALLVGVTAYVPRRLRSRRLEVVKQRELRRMWPGTGMKVTVDALPSPCFVADGRGITRYINQAALKRYGEMKPGDPLSFSLRAPSLLEAFDRVCSSGAAERINWTEKVPTEAWFEAHVSPVYMPGPSAGVKSGRLPDFVLVVIQDLSEQRRLERMRTDFVANASHELRTPLASLTGFIETIQGPARDDPAARDRFLQIMLEQAGRMRRLIDDILSLSRIELKAHVKPAALVDLVEIVRHTTDALAPLARDMNVEIETDIGVGEALVRGDRDELIQVTENLIENGLKYGSTGEKVAVSIKPVDPDDEPVNWSLVIRDFGEGIPAEHLPRLTERFYRVDVDSSRALKGTGLGLAIVKHILNRHRARLEIESAPGEGAAFKVHFPASDSD